MNLQIYNYAQKWHNEGIRGIFASAGSMPTTATQFLDKKIKKENRGRQKHIAIFEVFMLCYKILTKGNSK